MKINFGHYVLIAYIIGALFILFLVYLAFSLDFQMAEENYYSREKQMNKFLEGRNNSVRIGDLFTAEKKEADLLIRMNRNLLDSLQSVEIQIYCPSAKESDYLYESHLGIGDSLIVIPINKLKTGQNIIKAGVVAGNQFFYEEDNIFL